jgi:cell envelope opacity-associated protein A
LALFFVVKLPHIADSFAYCRVEGGIPPLVELLESPDLKVQRAAAGALRTLAFKNDENKTQVRYKKKKKEREKQSKH